MLSAAEFKLWEEINLDIKKQNKKNVHAERARKWVRSEIKDQINF